MASLDSEYSFEYKSDGSAIFYLPKFRKYILEKLYNQNNEPAWGAATYILDEDIYEENEENIINIPNISERILLLFGFVINPYLLILVISRTQAMYFSFEYMEKENVHCRIRCDGYIYFYTE